MRDEQGDEADIEHENKQSSTFLCLFSSCLDLKSNLERDLRLHSALALTETLKSCNHLWSYIIHTNLIYSQLK